MQVIGLPDKIQPLSEQPLSEQPLSECFDCWLLLLIQAS